NDAYLEPYRTASGEIKKMLDDLRRLTVDNRAQQRRLDSISPLIDSKLVELSSTLDQRRTGGLEAAARAVNSHLGKNLMDQIRAIAAEMNREEEDLLQQRNGEAEASVQATKQVVLDGSLLGVVLIMIIGWTITK